MPTALVTGTSTGIGLATAVSLARAGHKVFAAMRNPEGGGAEISAIAAQEKLPVTIVPLDVDDDASVSRCFAAAGPLDVLVNNAGIAMHGSVEELAIAEFKRTMETNFFGALRCIQAVVTGMRQRRSGLIVNVSSVAGRFSIAPQAPYAASKWALEAASEALAQELRAFNVRVAIVEPGVIATPIFGKPTFGPTESIYPHTRRINALFAAALKNPVSPYVVGDAIRDIAASDSWKLRYPVGPDAAELIAWRTSMTDEDWIAGGAVTDEQWVAYMKNARGLDVQL
ncbi:MAG: short-chain dehydrogenase/reductase [Candidatus Solibacter sp.]|jgi:NAD(P)-dependent dehydrogenase (short-subunit alcohol dehydrogenase family)|nr:short-chain dehydrogenase/reductase [Candidatus Solibacter sp.]